MAVWVLETFEILWDGFFDVAGSVKQSNGCDDAIFPETSRLLASHAIERGVATLCVLLVILRRLEAALGRCRTQKDFE